MLTKSCSYQIDTKDEIIYVGGTWSAFANANGGQSLLLNSPLGQPIWAFVNGLSTRFIYQTLINRVRSSRTPLVFPFRCDSPDTLRYMEMEISPGADDSIWFRTTLKREIGPNTLPSNKAPICLEKSIVKMCSWCQLINVRNNWLTLEDAIWFQGLMDGPEVPPITHGICPDCNEVMHQEIIFMHSSFQENFL
jgi:hypothetical protein